MGRQGERSVIVEVWVHEEGGGKRTGNVQGCFEDFKKKKKHNVHFLGPGFHGRGEGGGEKELLDTVRNRSAGASEESIELTREQRNKKIEKCEIGDYRKKEPFKRERSGLNRGATFDTRGKKRALTFGEGAISQVSKKNRIVFVD